MANYSTLKGDINDTVKTNGLQSISGAALNTILNEMVTSLGAGYNYMGVAVPTTNPGAPDPNVFYLASQAGTYTNFGGLVVNDGEVCALVYNGSWSKQVTGAATQEQLSQLGQEVDEGLYNEHTSEIRITDGISVFNGLARISASKFEAITSATIWIRYIPVVAGKKYRIRTIDAQGEQNDVPINTAWMGVMFSENAPANDGNATSVKNYSSSPAEVDEYYTAQSNGYVGVGINGSSAYLTRIQFWEVVTTKTLKTDDIEDEIEDIDTRLGAVEELGDKVDEIEGEFYEEETRTITHDVQTSIFQGIARISTAKYEAGSETSNTVYVPVVAGRQYRVHTNGNVKVQSAWMGIAFSENLPAANVSATSVKNYAETMVVTIDESYTPNLDGYLGVCVSGNISLLGPRVIFTETYTELVKIPITDELDERIEALEDDISSDACVALLTPPDAFNIGLTKLQSKTSNPTPLVISSSGSNYNAVINQYMNRQQDKRTSRLISSAHYDLYPNIGDPTKLNGTYFRMLIGVDSEGWAYIAQRKCSNNSGGADVNIYKTKDFETFVLFKENSAGAQLVEMENGELCFATYETEAVDNVYYIRCNIYITANNKTTFVKKFACTQISQYIPAAPWSWGLQTRGSVVCVGEYGQHGQCGCVWYSRDYGQTFAKCFDLRDNAPDVPHAHIHGVCVDPYFDRVIIINGDGSPSTTPALAYQNPKLWWWDYNGETIDNTLIDNIAWNHADVGLDISLGSNLQFVNGYALKDCIVLFSDGANNGIFRVNRGKKEDALTVDFALHLGVENVFTKWCGGNMFKMNENSPLLICAIREYSCDLNPGDPGNPSNRPNTYEDVLSRVYSTYDGFHFEEVWVDDTYGTYDVFYTDDSTEQRNLAKCGRDMSVYQLPNGDVLLKYLGRDFQYVAYNNNGVTGNKNAYVRFNNEVEKLHFK